MFLLLYFVAEDHSILCVQTILNFELYFVIDFILLNLLTVLHHCLDSRERVKGVDAALRWKENTYALSPWQSTADDRESLQLSHPRIHDPSARIVGRARQERAAGPEADGDGQTTGPRRAYVLAALWACVGGNPRLAKSSENLWDSESIIGLYVTRRPAVAVMVQTSEEEGGPDDA